MGVKNIFKKSSKIFDKEGFYIILFVCLCIVAVAAVYMSRNNADAVKNLTDAGKNIENQAPVDKDKDLVDNKQPDTSVPTSGKPVSNSGTSSTSTKTGSSTSTSKNTTSSFKIAMPVEGTISETMGFSDKRPVKSLTLNQWETHPAIDIMAEQQAEVKAAFDGKVEEVITEDIIVDDSDRTGYGITVVINHNNGYKTVYANLSESLKVKKGDTVKKGQVIGYVGDTSSRELVSVEGSHLHFELLKKTGNEYVEVDPTKYLEVKKQ